MLGFTFVLNLLNCSLKVGIFHQRIMICKIFTPAVDFLNCTQQLVYSFFTICIQPVCFDCISLVWIKILILNILKAQTQTNNYILTLTVKFPLELSIHLNEEVCTLALYPIRILFVSALFFSKTNWLLFLWGF